jgi:hypothetical protein
MLGGLPRVALLLALTAAALLVTAGAGARSAALPLLYISPSGSDSSGCTRAAPCKSFARAYRVARPGQTVVVAAGRYEGQQEIPVDRNKTAAADVLLRAAPGAAVLVDSLDVYGSHVEIRGVRIARDFYVKCGADDVTLRSSKATLFFIRSATNVRIVRSEFGPSSDISQIGHTAECQRSPDRIVMDRVYMHDYVNPDTHMECLTVQAANNFVLRNSRFRRCQDFDVLFKHRSPVLTSTNVTIENNWFDDPEPTGMSAIQFSEPDGGGTYENVLIRHNSFMGKLTMKPDVGYRNAVVVANAGNRYGGPCGDSDVRTAFNVWADGGCRGDKRAQPGFRNASAFDFHLAAGAAAINAGDPKSFPTRDIDGQRRPRGGRPDAGADEHAPTPRARNN